MEIRTMKIQPDDTRGERVRATAAGRRLTVPWDYALNTEAMHEYAARLLARKLVESYAAPEVRVVRGLPAGYLFETTDVN